MAAPDPKTNVMKTLQQPRACRAPLQASTGQQAWDRVHCLPPSELRPPELVTAHTTSRAAPTAGAPLGGVHCAAVVAAVEAALVARLAQRDEAQMELPAQADRCGQKWAGPRAFLGWLAPRGVGAPAPRSESRWARGGASPLGREELGSVLGAAVAAEPRLSGRLHALCGPTDEEHRDTHAATAVCGLACGR